MSRRILVGCDGSPESGVAFMSSLCRLAFSDPAPDVLRAVEQPDTGILARAKMLRIQADVQGIKKSPRWSVCRSYAL
jgi:hypothetical protein